MNVFEELGIQSLKLLTKDPKQILLFYNLDIEEITKKSIMITILGLIPFTYLMLLATSTLIALMTPFIGLILFVIFINRYSFAYSQVMGTIEEHADLIYNELATVKIYSNSIIDAIHFIADGKYPILSEELQTILHKIQLGASPEKEIQGLLTRYPSPILIEGWGLFFNQHKISEKNLQVNQELAQQISLNRFEEQTSQLETRIMLYVGLSLFLIPLFQILSTIVGWTIFSLISLLPLGMFLLILEFGWGVPSNARRATSSPAVLRRCAISKAM